MAEVLREALSSARSRRDTRRIELGLEPEKEEQAKKAQLTIVQPQQTEEKDGSLAWMLMVMVAWDRSRQQMRLQAQPLQGFSAL